MRFVPGRFSVVVPSFQQGGFLERTLQSIFRQDWPDVEVIVQDGGSTDASVEILKRYGDRIRWESKPDGGQSAAINEGLRKATGEFLCYMCSDDVLYPGALRRVAEFLAAHGNVEVVYGEADFIDDRDEILGSYPVEPWNYTRLRETCFICQPACFWRRAVFEEHGGFDESLKYSMDYEYWLRVGAHVPFHFLPVKLAASRCHVEAKGFAGMTQHFATTISVLKRYNAGLIPPRWAVAYARARAEQTLTKPARRAMQAARFAGVYWFQLFKLAPRVTSGGGRVLLSKLGPPYPSARRRVGDPLNYLKADLTSANL